MAVASGTTYEIRTTGNDSNGGGFNPLASGTDRSQQDSPHVIIDGTTITAVVAATTTNLTLVGYTPASSDVGNIVAIRGGSATAGPYEIKSISGQNWVLDRSAGTVGQTATGRMGGALASIGQFGADHTIIGNVMLLAWLKAGTYTVDGATNNVSGGRYSIPGFATNTGIRGYNSTRNDLYNAGNGLTRPVLQATGTWSGSVAIAKLGASRLGWVEGITFDMNSKASSVAINSQGTNCRFINPASTSAISSGTGQLVCCSAVGNWVGSCGISYAFGCYFEGIPVGVGIYEECIFKSMASGQAPIRSATCRRCVFDGYSTLFSDSYATIRIENCWFRNCAAWGSATTHGALVYKSFRYGTMSDDANNTWANNKYVDVTTLGSDPFVNATAGDYRLTASAIASYRNSTLNKPAEDVSGEPYWTDVIPYSSGSGGLRAPFSMLGGFEE